MNVEDLKNISIIDVLKVIEINLKITFNLVDNKFLDCPHCIGVNSKGRKHRAIIYGNVIRCMDENCPSHFHWLNTARLVGVVYKKEMYDAIFKLMELIKFTGNKKLEGELLEERVRKEYVRYCNKVLLANYDIVKEGKYVKRNTYDLVGDMVEYLIKRGITKEVIIQYKIGITDNFFRNYAIKTFGFTPTELVDSGVMAYRNLKDDKGQYVLDDNKKKVKDSNKQYEVCYSCIMIPNFENGVCKSITGRNIDNSGKSQRYLNISNAKSIINGDNAIYSSKIFFFEGALNAVSYSVLFKKYNCVALQGASTFKRSFLEQFVITNFNKRNCEVIFVTDNDEAGRKKFPEYAMLLEQLGIKTSIMLTDLDSNGKKIDMNDVLIGNSTVDAIKIWNRQYENRLDTLSAMVEFNKIGRVLSGNEYYEKFRIARFLESQLKKFNPNQRARYMESVSSFELDWKSMLKVLDKYDKKAIVDKNNKIVCLVNPEESVSKLIREADIGFTEVSQRSTVSFRGVDRDVSLIIVSELCNIANVERMCSILKKQGFKNIKLSMKEKVANVVDYYLLVNTAKRYDGVMNYLNN